MGFSFSSEGDFFNGKAIQLSYNGSLRGDGDHAEIIYSGEGNVAGQPQREKLNGKLNRGRLRQWASLSVPSLANTRFGVCLVALKSWE
jgi:hypothetical protein